MTNLKRIISLTASIVLTVTLFANVDANKTTQLEQAKTNLTNQIDCDGHSKTTVVDVVIEHEDLDILKQAVIYAGLADALAQLESVTVFAPTNEAFSIFMKKNNFKELQDIPKDVLKSVLLYHTISQGVNSSNLEEGYISTLNVTTEGHPISLYATPAKGLLNGTAKIIQTDLMASNGVVHIIDEVLMPPTVVSHALNNPAFSVLVDAVVKAGLVESLSSEGPFTVFAPTNSAFYALFKDLGVTGINEISEDVLTQVLLSHVFIGNVTSNMVASGDVQTLNTNKPLMVKVTKKGVVIDNKINVVATDVQGSNGIIHVIDGVILPSFETSQNTK